MAQVLKDETRKSIIIAAKQEFAEKGYKGASMRNIAAKANMTVGNLYRYYKNKEEINLNIVAPTYKKIDAALKILEKDDISLQTRVFNLKPEVKDVINMFDEFCDSLVEIYIDHKEEFSILLLHSRLSKEIVSIFSDIINSMIVDNFSLIGSNDEINCITKAYAESLLMGIKTIFNSNINDRNSLLKTLKIYVRSFITMLDNDIRKFAE